MIALLLMVAAIVAVVALPVLLVALTGGRGLLYTHRTLPRPRTRRVPRRADR